MKIKQNYHIIGEMLYKWGDNVLGYLASVV